MSGIHIKKIPLAATVIAAIAVCFYGTWRGIQKNETLRTGIKYFIADIATVHTEDGLLIGSSTMRYMDQYKYLNCGTWLNRGIGGTAISTLHLYLSFSPLSASPRHIVIYAGENDIVRGVTPEMTVDNYIRFLSRLREKYPESVLHVIAIKPSPARKRHWDGFYRVNSSMEAHLREIEKAFFHPGDWAETFYDSPLSFTGDGIHLDADGYIEFIKEINEICK